MCPPIITNAYITTTITHLVIVVLGVKLNRFLPIYLFFFKRIFIFIFSLQTHISFIISKQTVSLNTLHTKINYLFCFGLQTTHTYPHRNSNEFLFQHSNSNFNKTKQKFIRFCVISTFFFSR